MKFSRRFLPTITSFFLASILMTLLLSACTTAQFEQWAKTGEQGDGIILLLLAPSIPQDELAIQERIEDGFEQLLYTSSFRAHVEPGISPLPPFPLIYKQITLTLPFMVEGTIEFDVETNITDEISIHLVDQKLEGIYKISVNSVTDDGSRSISHKFWYNFGSGWRNQIEYDEVSHGLLGVMMLVGSPYDTLEPPRGHRFHSSAVGYENLDGRLSEHYAVKSEITEPDGHISSSATMHIWLDAESGLPMRSVSDYAIINYEKIDRLGIEPPCDGPCEGNGEWLKYDHINRTLCPRHTPLVDSIARSCLVCAGDIKTL